MRIQVRSQVLMAAFVSLVWGVSFAQSLRCGKVYGELTLRDLKETLTAQKTESQIFSRRFVLLFDQIDPQLILGRKTPKWEDFENLKIIRSQYEAGLQTLRTRGGEKAIQDFYREWDQAYSNFNRRRQFEEASGNFLEIQYGTIDYGLRAAYRDELLKLNPRLPSQMRFALKPLPRDVLKDQLRQQGVEIVRELESTVDQLYPSSGYKTEKDLVEAIHKGGTPLVRSNLDMILSEDVEFAIARPENARWWIPKVGFHNQFVTGTSRGYQGAEGRNALEASRLGVSVADYAAQNPDLKPKYGWLIPKINSKRQRKDVSYGSDYFILDKDRLRSRTTWTPSDSLNPVGTWLRKWYYGVGGTPTHWEHLFIPWARRALLAPLMADSLNAPLTTIGSKLAGVGDGLPTFERAFERNEYIELQYWGPVTLDDVKVFVFRQSAPSGEFLAELQSRKIPILRAIGSEYIEWKPEK